MTGQIEEYRGALAMLKAMPIELKLVIAGNHDLSLHKDYYLNARTRMAISTHTASMKNMIRRRPKSLNLCGPGKHGMPESCI